MVTKKAVVVAWERVGCACSHVYQKTFRDSPHRPLLQMS